MRHLLRKSTFAALAAALLAGAPAPHAQQIDPAQVEIAAQELAPGLYMLVGRGGNMGLSIGPDGAFLIDDQYAPLSDKIKAAIAKLTPKPVRFVVNTHWHFDHTGGNEAFGEAAAAIVAHDAVRTRLAKGQKYEKIFQLEVPPAAHAALPVITFREDLTFHLNGDELHVYHLPNAHTDGDAVVRFTKANVLHGGDLLFYPAYPVIDLESGGSIDGMIAAVQKLHEQCDDQTKIIPGHGPLMDKGQLGSYLAMLKKVRANVAGLIAAGKTADQVLAAKPTAEFDGVWGKGFIKPEIFAAVLYASLTEVPTARR
jgi:cyclase